MLKSLYIARNMECNKRMLRDVYLEAESTQLNDDCDSDASSSSESEGEKIAETDKMKKALEEL